MSDSLEIPKVLMVVKPVDGGRGAIGLIECPYCGQTHYTAMLHLGQRDFFCGSQAGNAERPDGYSTLNVIALLGDNGEAA